MLLGYSAAAVVCFACAVLQGIRSCYLTGASIGAVCCCVQVLVVGDSGLGKTTLVKTLLSTPGERLQVGSDAGAAGRCVRLRSRAPQNQLQLRTHSSTAELHKRTHS